MAWSHVNRAEINARRPLKNPIPESFGYFTVLGREGVPNGERLWRLRCICGQERVKSTAAITCMRKRKFGTSCGCRNAEFVSLATSKHGRVGSSIYKVWQGMIERCLPSNAERYPGYAGRGIKVCEAWHSFPAFLADMGERPEGKSLDRINNDGNYEPSNCRWATVKEQCRNRRNCRLITYKGKTVTVTEWAEILGINHITLYARIFHHKWPIERAMTYPVTKRRPRTKRALGDI